jgi:hypothetical protein
VSGAHPSEVGAGTLMSAALAVMARPRLWGTAAAVLVRMAPPGWWRRPPHLPVPDPRLWAFRMVTAYGAADAPPRRSDVVAYLEWCRTTGPLVHRPPADRG